jgi:hypothetical protein
MYIPLPNPNLKELTPEEQEKYYFDKIRFDSHKFVENHNGIAICEFCKSIVTPYISFDSVKLCLMNPHLFPNDFIAKIKEKEIKRN